MTPSRQSAMQRSKPAPGASGDPMSDAEYKREMASVHARRVVRAAAARAGV